MKKPRAGPRRSPGRPSGVPTAARRASTIRYIESSALVAAILEGDAAAQASIRAHGERITSALTVAETSRAVLRAQLSGRITPRQQQAALLTLRTFARRCHIISITDAILAEASRRFPAEPVRTLDAIHLASAAAVGEPPALVTIVTRDVRVRDNAIAWGHPVE